MAIEQPATAPSPRPVPPPPPPPRSSGRGWLLPALLVLAVAGGVGWYAWHSRQNTAEAAHDGGHEATASHEGDEGAEAGMPRVEVVTPRKGGMQRTTTQPGTVTAYEWADLYAKISGYVKTMKVDIGDSVKEGDLLVEIEDPEVHKAVELAKATLDQAKAAITQAEARVKTSKADVAAAQARVKKAQADVKETTAQRVYRHSELERITELAQRRSVERKLVDEEQERYASAVAAEAAAEAAVATAEAEVRSSEAVVEQSQADLAEARANVEVAQADLEKAQVIADYTQIHSPYDGVITQRNFHRGAFIRSASDGNNIPVVSVARTDKLRVVVKVPDRDVPYVDRGDPAVIRIDALPGKEFKGEVARKADSEDPADRTMRTEIDLENKEDLLHDGMYGGVTIMLEPPSENMTIPAVSLIEQDSQGDGAVYVVRGGKIHKQPVRIGKDNGLEVEVKEGLAPNDQVVVRYNGAMTEGLAVRTEQAAETAVAAASPAAH